MDPAVVPQSIHITITRRRDAERGLEESTIDFFIVSQDMVPSITDMIIDEARTNVLTKFSTAKGRKSLKESDHNMLICKFDIKLKKETKSEKREIFNLRNKVNQEKFHDLTDNTRKFTNCFKRDGEDIETQTKKWYKVSSVTVL